MTRFRVAGVGVRAAAAIAVVAMIVLGAIGLLAVPAFGDETPRTALGPPRFEDVTAAAGIDHIYDGDAAFAVGGGVAVFDCNGSGRPDLYVAGGSNPAALYRNDSPIGGPLKFTRLPDPTTDLTGVIGAYPLDLLGDGQVDLVVLRKGGTIVLHGLGNCRFERTELTLGTGLPTAFSATWEGTNALPTLALGLYLGLDGAGRLTDTCADNLLIRPVDGAPAYPPPAPLQPGYCPLSMLFSDWDRSGRRDLRITNDRQYYVDGQDQLWRIAAGESPRQYTATDGWVRLQVWGMGIASFDITGRGYPDVFITSQGDNKFQTLTAGPGQPTYRDMALKRGVTAAQPFTGGDIRPSTAWHPEFADVNNDGFIDLFVSKGNVSVMPDYAIRDPNNLFLGQTDATFKESADAAGVLNYARGRGAALADFTLDGMLDLVEVNYGAPLKIWKNVGGGDIQRPVPMGNWLGLRLRQPGPNRDAIGAWLEVQIGTSISRRELTVGGGHAGGQLGWTHFGLGNARHAQVRVQWPDGETGPWLRADANQFAILERGQNRIQTWRP